MNCSICAGIDPAVTNVENGRLLGTSEASIRRHLIANHNDPDRNDPFFTEVPVSQITSRGRTVRLLDGSYEKVTFKPSSTATEDEYVDIDPSGILNSLDRAIVNRFEGSGAFVVSLNDWQIGKLEGGGSEATIKRVKASVQAAIVRINELRSIGRELGTLVIIGGGDIIEGCNIFPNQANNSDLHRHDQIVSAVSLAQWVFDQLSAKFDKVTALVVKGNHGENRQNGRKTHDGDNDDTLVFKMVKVASERDPALKHIEWTIAEGHEEFATAQVGNWRLGTTHGDVFGKSPGQNSKKAWEWYKNMRAGGFELGNVDVFISHHFHHEEKADWGRCLWVQTRAQDGGSKFFESYSGQYSQSGMLSFVMTDTNRYQDEAYL